MNSKKLLRKKTKKNKKILLNSKNKSCKSQKFTACCPHMIPDNEGRYAATGIKHILKYKGNNYKLMTCCQMCGDVMNKISKENPKKFAKLYIKYIDKNGNIHAKNRHTNEVVQILKKI